MFRKPVIAAVCALGAFALPSGVAAQDFDCRTATLMAEKTICATPHLSRLDDRMAELYGRLWRRLDDENREGLRDYQRMFLDTRNACRRDVACIEGAYRDQISVLSGQLDRQRRHRPAT